MSKHLVAGTAGHIDHGKSSLVLALTGTDPDRWEEEKRRGITIDIGFAHLDLPSLRVSFVDVPGHERFVHNMLAGATGVDLVVLVVAADESVMPQTREHLAICDLLGVRRGIVAITRIDLVEDGMVDLVRDDIAGLVLGTFLDGAPVVPVSSVTGAGLDDLRAAIARQAEALEDVDVGPWPRLPVDRVFAARGFGTIVTGTLQGGSLAIGDVLAGAPGRVQARVRGVQVHGESVERAGPHRRVAVNLQGVERSELERGVVLAPPGRALTTQVFDALARVIAASPAPLEDGMRVRVHHYTAEVMGRLRVPAPGSLAAGEEGAVQVRLEAPLAALPGDRFVLRRYSPLETLGGGTIVDIDPPRWRRADPTWPDRTRALAREAPRERLRRAIEESGAQGVSLAERAMRWAIEPDDARRMCEAGLGDPPILVLGRDRAISPAGLEAFVNEVRAVLDAFHAERPLEDGLSPDRLRAQVAPLWTIDEVREALATDKAQRSVVVGANAVALKKHRVALDPSAAADLERLRAALERAGLEARTTDELVAETGVPRSRREALILAARRREVIRVKEDLWLASGPWQQLVETLRAEAAAGRDVIDVARFKDLFGLSRKYAIPILECLDDMGVTRRAGNQRVIRSVGSPGAE